MTFDAQIVNIFCQLLFIMLYIILYIYVDWFKHYMKIAYRIKVNKLFLKSSTK